VNILDRFLGLHVIEDLTDTTWWIDTIFSGLEQENAGDDSVDREVDAGPGALPAELT
jgi:hypothetical protein